jgi:Xaa-Pro aminopeptidase
MEPRRERAAEIAREAGAGALLAADPATVTWLTGYAADIETGPSPFAHAPLAVVAPGAPPVLIVSEDEADAAAAGGCEVVTYPGFGLDPLDPVGGAARALADVIPDVPVATECGALAASLAAGLNTVEVGPELARARAVKDEDEIALLRAALELCDAGQRAAREHARPGMTELDLWALVRAAIERVASERTPVLADLVAGPRTAEVGGPPGGRVLADGDLVLCDLVPRRGGYWGDSCSTFAVGEPSATARGRHRAATDALARAIEAVRPGVVAGEIDALVRPGLDYPHHTGHGLGTTFHEEPRIVPGSTVVLEPGMVIALEPGSYGEGEGVRVEQIVLVTKDGYEVMSGHELAL